MNSIQIQVLAIAIIASIATTLPGVFLVFRGVALMSDAISHAILLGIAVMFLIIQNLHSIWLIIGAALSGLLTVIATEMLIKTNRLKKDAAIGLVFPLFFATGVILISRYARNVHLDTDMVILGELAFAPFNRLLLWNIDCGPWALWVVSGIMILNIVFVTLFYKELILSTFDKTFAQITHFHPSIIHYGLMSLVSITAVGVFDVVGAVIVVALMITPPATAYLLSNHMQTIIKISLLLSCLSSISGYYIAHTFNVSIAGCIASMCGFYFLLALIASPSKGLLAQWIKQRKINHTLVKQILQKDLHNHSIL